MVVTRALCDLVLGQELGVPAERQRQYVQGREPGYSSLEFKRMINDFAFPRASRIPDAVRKMNPAVATPSRRPARPLMMHPSSGTTGPDRRSRPPASCSVPITTLVRRRATVASGTGTARRRQEQHPRGNPASSSSRTGVLVGDLCVAAEPQLVPPVAAGRTEQRRTHHPAAAPHLQLHPAMREADGRFAPAVKIGRGSSGKRRTEMAGCWITRRSPGVQAPPGCSRA
jgi:hypothetical protein